MSELGWPGGVTFSARHPGTCLQPALRLASATSFSTVCVASVLKSLFCPRTSPLLKTSVAPARTGPAWLAQPDSVTPHRPLLPRAPPLCCSGGVQHRPPALATFSVRWSVPGGGCGFWFAMLQSSAPHRRGPQIEMGDTYLGSVRISERSLLGFRFC